MTSDLLALAALALPLGLQYAARCLEERQLRRQEFALWRDSQFVLAEARDQRRVGSWGANGVVLDALLSVPYRRVETDLHPTRAARHYYTTAVWYSGCGGARSSAARSARPGVLRGQPSAPLLLACCRRLRYRRLL